MKPSLKPPFEITLKILKLSLDIQDILGSFKSIEIVKPSVKLRKQNKIKTIHHSLVIEGNSLTMEQVTQILENKRVLGSKKEICEVQNAINLYDQLHNFSIKSEKHFLNAHKILMADLISKPGYYRNTNVGILKGSKVSHIAPQAKLVSKLMANLFSFLKSNADVTFLIKACVFHYELEFIHPFEDGNGRMGRLWQQLVLMKHSPVFEYLAVETLIHKNQKEYYSVLENCDKLGNSTLFIEFSLDLILKALKEFQSEYKPKKLNSNERLQHANNHFKNNYFFRKEYMLIFSDISTATASRDLSQGVINKLLIVSGEFNKSKYKFK